MAENLEASPVKKRGRPTPSQAAAINLAILDTARIMFLQDGYSTISMETVARRAGVSKGTLYARFTSKAALFKSVVEERATVWAAESARAYKLKITTLEGRLTHFALITLEKLTKSEIRSFTDLLLTEFRQSPEIAKIYFHISFAIGIDLLISEIGAGATEDGMTVRDPHAMGMTLLEMLWGWVSLQILQGNEPSKAACKRTAKHSVAILLAAERIR